MVKFNFPSGALDTILLWRYYSCQQSPPAKEVFVIQELYMKLLTIAFYRRYRLQLAVFGLFIFAPWAFPQLPAIAAESQSLNVAEVVPLMVPYLSSAPTDVLLFPQAGLRPERYTIKLPATAYSSTPDQTDSTPFITASGSNVIWGVVAANFLPIGTRLRLPDHYGDQVFVVEDRMNERYNVRLDIWMESREQAKHWGLKQVVVEVL